jgi:hypothetical protein
MGYKLNQEGWTAIEKIAEQLSALAEGKSLVLKDNREAIDKLRYHVYAWLYETGKKPEFKVIRKAPESLEIKRKCVLCPTIVSDDTIEAFVTCNLLEIDDESEAQRRISSAVQSNELTGNEGVGAMSEWRRIQGRSR